MSSGKFERAEQIVQKSGVAQTAEHLLKIAVLDDLKSVVGTEEEAMNRLHALFMTRIPEHLRVQHDRWPPEVLQRVHRIQSSEYGVDRARPGRQAFQGRSGSAAMR